VRLTPWFHPVPQLRVSAATPVITLYVLTAWRGTTLTLPPLSLISLNTQFALTVHSPWQHSVYSYCALTVATLTLLLLCTHRGNTHCALTVHSPWQHSLCSYCALAVATLTLLLLCTRHGNTHFALTVHSPWQHSLCSYCALTVATLTLLLLYTHRGALQQNAHNALYSCQEDSLWAGLCWHTGAEPGSVLVFHAE
jgi:hypothetical protein